jgi:hypothetical protein
MPKTTSTGCTEITILLRDVWTDQVDDLGEDCSICQTEGHSICCNVYLPALHRRTELINCCWSCVMQVVGDAGPEACYAPVIVEVASKGDR